MNPDELRALADTVNSIYAETYTQREAIDSVVAYLRAQADAQPVAWIKTTHAGVRRLEWNEQTHYANNDYPATTEPLYLRPAPQRQPGPTPEQEAALQRMADNARELGLDYEPMPQPERQPLTDEQVDEIGEPFGYFTYGDAQGDKRRAFVRAVERAHGIGGSDGN